MLAHQSRILPSTIKAVRRTKGSNRDGGDDGPSGHSTTPQQTEIRVGSVSEVKPFKSKTTSSIGSAYSQTEINESNRDNASVYSKDPSIYPSRITRNSNKTASAASSSNKTSSRTLS